MLMRPTEHPALLHYHIYKNAGSSVDRLLLENFGRSWARFEQTSRPGVTDSNQLNSFLTRHPHIRAVSSHSAHPPLPAPFVRPIVMLRHPVDRARSVYHFARRDRTQPDHEVAISTSFRGYVEHFLPLEDAGVIIRDYQVVHLSPASIRCKHIQLAKATPADLDYAKSVLTGWGVFGIVRQFAASCRLFNAAYSQEFPSLRFREVTENVSTDASANDEWALTTARSELGEDTFRRLLEANALDSELYEFARWEFHRQIAGFMSHAGPMPLVPGVECVAK
jgi:hypothetical protein